MWYGRIEGSEVLADEQLQESRDWGDVGRR